MSSNAARADKPTDRRTAFDPALTTHVYLGRDAEGYHHHLDRSTATVHRVAADGTRERTVDLLARERDETAAGALEAYLAFVARSVAWDDRRKYTARDLFGVPGR